MMKVPQNVRNVFSGEHKYTVGLVFVFGNLAGYFLNMRKCGVYDTQSFIVLILMALVARMLV